MNNRLLGWKLLLDVQEVMSDWSGVEVTCSATLRFINDNPPTPASIPGGEELEVYCARLRLAKAKALVHMGHINHLRQAVDVLKNVRRLC